MALAGVRVIDTSTLFAGPLIATWLGDFGAEVIKVEHPRGGDPLRGLGWERDGVPLWWKIVGRNKKSVTLDLNKPAGQRILRRLAASADVLVENFRPGRLEAWGLGWQRLHRANPRLVMVRVTGWGQTGPYSQRPGFGTLAEAMSGFAHVTGQVDGPPTLPPFGLADAITALIGTFGAAAALYERDALRSGRGQVVDVSILESMFTVLGPHVTVHDQLGIVIGRSGNRVPFSCPRNLYRTRDGKWLALSASTESIAQRVFSIIGREDMARDARYQTNRARLAHCDDVDRAIQDWIAKRDLDAVLAAFDAGEGAIAPVLSAADLAQDPHMLARSAIISVADADLGQLRMQGVFPVLSRNPGRVQSAGPRLGQHTNEVLGVMLGMATEEIERLRAAGVV